MITAIRVALGTASFAELFAVTFVEPVETHGVEDLPEGVPVAKDPDECSFAGRAVKLQHNSHQVLPSCGRLVIDIASAT
jgi:hypothetical protein